MKKTPIFIFIDCVFRDYKCFWGKCWENNLVNDLKTYLSEFKKDSEITLIIEDEPFLVAHWLVKNALDKYVDSIMRPKTF